MTFMWCSSWDGSFIFFTFVQEIFPSPNGRIDGPVIFEKMHCCRVLRWIKKCTMMYVLNIERYFINKQIHLWRNSTSNPGTNLCVTVRKSFDE